MPNPVTPILPPFDLIHPITVGVSQSDYIGLPAIVSTGPYGMITSRWKFSWKERFKILLFGNVWLQQLAFHKPVQPVKLLVIQPEIQDICQ